MAKPSAPDAVPTIEIMMRSDRILWRPGRAMIQGARDRLDEYLPGLINFAFYEMELRKLERELREEWGAYEADLKLTHQVDGESLRQWPRVNEMTRIAGTRRMRLARLERRLEKPSIALHPAVQRLVSELIVQADTADRMKTVDERLEIMENIYESANDRLSEYSFFSRELRAEAWIIVILVFEAILIIAEIAMTLIQSSRA
jgi:hypothetical protein